MTTIEALNDLSVAMGCGNAEGETTAEMLNYIAEHYTPPIHNYFDIATAVNGILNVETGTLFEGTENIKTSDCINLAPGTYKISSTKNEAESVYYDWYVCTYDSDKTFVERTAMTRVDDSTYTFTLINSANVRFSFSTLLTNITLTKEVD